MGKTRFTEQQIADFLSQSRHGVSDRYLCEKYRFSTATLRRWKEQHDAVIRHELSKMETYSLMIFFCLLAASLLAAAVFTKDLATLYLPLLFAHCTIYIMRYRRKSSGFIIRGNKCLARAGPGANNAFYLFSWIVVFFFVFVLLSGSLNVIDEYFVYGMT